jgi:hypothetical protein
MLAIKSSGCFDRGLTIMRKVTKETVEALVNGKRRVVGNTSTDGVTLKLHGNTIARILPFSGVVMVTMAGWPTVTTRERLNGLCELLGLGRPFHQKRNLQFFRNERVSSEDWFVLTTPDGAEVKVVR